MQMFGKDSSELNQKINLARKKIRKSDEKYQKESKISTLKELEDLCFEKRKKAIHFLCARRNSASKTVSLAPIIFKKKIRSELQDGEKIDEMRVLLLGCIGGILKSINKR